MKKHPVKKALAAVSVGIVVLVAVAVTAADDTELDTTTAGASAAVPILAEPDGDGSPGPRGWRKSDVLPNNVIEGFDNMYAKPLWIRAGVREVEPWKGMVFDVPEGSSYGVDDLVETSFDDPRIDGDGSVGGWRYWKIWLDVQHTFGDERPAPEYVILNGGQISQYLDAKTLADQVATYSDGLWMVTVNGEDPPHLTTTADVYPIDDNGNLDFEGYGKIDELERQSEGPGHVIVIQTDADGYFVAERRRR